MALDFSQLKMLVGPRFKRIRAERGDRERLAANKHAKRKRPKNHATNQERSYIERTRAAEHKKAAEAKLTAWYSLRDQIRAYWRGEADEHP